MIQRGTIITCSNEECNKDLFRLLADLEIGDTLRVDQIQSIDIPKDKLPEPGDPMICPHCYARFIIPGQNATKITKIHTSEGWDIF